MPRPKIPKPIERRLMYESAYVCVICQQGGCQIHHIDQNHSNNNESNLVVLCVKHHDEAHTKRQLSKNLDSAALREAKKKWCERVEKQRSLLSTTTGQLSLLNNNSFFSGGITWGYINHKRVAQMADPKLLGPDESRYFQYCKDRGLVDENAVAIKPDNSPQASSVTNGTIYDWFEFGDDQRVHHVYIALVDQIASRNRVVHLEPPIWTKSNIKELVKPGAVIFLNKALYFKLEKSEKDNEHRKCRTFKRKIEIVFYVDTRDMFGVTSIAVSFTGHRSCASLIQLKSFEETNDGKLILHCTPIALGVGFREFQPNAL